MESLDTTNHYVTRVLHEPAEVDTAQWDALLASQAHPTPFMKAAFLQALHASGSACSHTGWQPRFLTLWRQGRLAAACAAYLKHHSYGEYVFDWAWAQAHERHGLPYYPKLLTAAPFTPVPGTRLLAVDDKARLALCRELTKQVREQSLSSAHVLFVDEMDAEALRESGWMIRQGVQFHWTQDPHNPSRSFDDFLSRLQREKRKKIQQEQRRVREAGVRFTAHVGSEIDEGLWDYFHLCYSLTYRLHHSTPYLSREFFTGVAHTMPQHWALFVARVEDQPVGCSLIALDPQQRVAYGRYWGSTQHIPCLHFDACYYQPLAWCLQQGYVRFEGGAQGEHKMARGLLPVPTRSAHWLADERFAHAVDDFLQREGAHVGAYLDELREHSPFKAP